MHSIQKLLWQLSFLFLVLNSCSLLESPPAQKLDPEVYYRNNMCFEYDGRKFCGVGVVPEDNLLKIKVLTGNIIDELVMTTCHREIQSTRPDKGLFRKNGVAKLTLRPRYELGKACPYYFGSFNKNGRHSWGVIIPEDSKYKLEAMVECNGRYHRAKGTVGCESRQGLMQRVVFNEPVILAKPTNGPAQRKEDCPALSLSNNEKILEFRMPNRECLYGIIGKESKKAMKLYTFGYEKLPVE